MTLLISSIKKHYLPALAFLIPFTIYLLTLYPTVPTEDGGELITAAYHLGIPHPPGYPLFTILGKFFITLNPFGNIAWKVNVMSAFFNAAAALLIFLFLRNYTKSTIIAIACAWLFAFVDISWSQSIRAEVYTLQNFLQMLVLLCVYQWQKNTKNNLWWYAICFTYGLSLTNHHVMFIFAPPLALFVLLADKTLWKDWKRILSGTAFFILGLSLYLYLPIRSAANPAIDWGNPENFENFWRHVTRAQYGGTIKVSTDQGIPIIGQTSAGVDPQLNIAVAAIKSLISPIFKTIRYAFLYLPIHLNQILIQFVYILIPFSFIGLTAPTKPVKKFHWFIIGSFIFYSLVMLHFIDPLNDAGDYRFGSRPFLLPMILLITLLIGVGLNKSTNFLKSKFSKIPSILFSLIIIAIPLTTLALNYHQQDQHQNYLNYDINKYILSSVPDNAFLYNKHDESHDFGIMYLQKVENYKPKVTIYGEANKLPYQPWPGLQNLTKDHPYSRYFSLNIPPDDNLFYQILPHGAIYELALPENYSRENSKKLADYYGNEISAIKFRGAELDNLDIRSTVLLSRIYQNVANYVYLADPQKAKTFLKKAESVLAKKSSNYEILASQYLKFGEAQEAIALLNKSQELEPNRFDTILNFGIAYEFLGDTEKSQTYFAQAEKINSRQYYFELSDQFKRAGLCDQAFITLQKVYPDQLPWVHIETANCYISQRQNAAAIEHLNQSINLLEPDHEAIPEIKNKIQRLQ